LFVVGCARSGSTLLQTFLAAHPAIFSFPETAVFARLFGAPSLAAPPANDTGVRIEASYARTTALLDAMGRGDLDRILAASPDLDVGINRWSDSARCTRARRDAPQLLLVRYGKLVSDTAAVLRETCRFIGLPFRQEMTERRAEGARALVTMAEPWKTDVFGPVRPQPDDKFDRLQRRTEGVHLGTPRTDRFLIATPVELEIAR
jgi:sulfotransferase family protein